MLKLLKLLLITLLLLGIVLFLNESSPIVAFEVDNKKIKTTLFLFGLASALIMALLYIIMRSTYSIITLPLIIKRNYQRKVNESKFDSLKDFIIAANQHDASKANKALSFLMSADIPEYFKSWLNYQRNLINHSSIKESIEDMLHYPETANLSLMKLVEEEISHGKYQKALEHLKTLPTSIPPKWLFLTSVKAYFGERRWSNLLEFLQQSEFNDFAKDHLIDICNYKIAEEIYLSKISFEALKEATVLIEKIKSPLEPAIYLYALLLIKITDYEAAVKFIGKSWSKYSHILFKPAILLIGTYENPAKTVSKIIGASNGLEVSIILSMYAVVINRDLKAIKKLLSAHQYNITDKFVRFFEHYHANIIEEKSKTAIELFTDNLSNLIETSYYFYDFNSMTVQIIENKEGSFAQVSMLKARPIIFS
ncbi:MAG: putative protein HemY, contains HemY_N domain and TPR repeats (unrelated to HemY-type protoporphyrinogen oxidase) [Candidatus Midichloria mitochondrii]|nr:hypothetical protein [Candidatus Midichloria mitochondrii]MDJ1287737.1 hypothetical protein [Candidatus Midichloria mitochondrii]MDJ1298601.1 hypothetical protein [Candidatus Midichloria mitochondrii]MDJ1312751.1 hypothetical protein [Candidatus Midichloria mitochondrii]MDJ1583319.1 hypothetical protein [Candidatus Midichloria mitochondrii]